MAAFERATVGLVLWWSANNAFAANPSGALAVSRLGVAETAERIESDMRARGLAVVGRTDHSADARHNGFTIRPVQTISIDHGSERAATRLVIWKAAHGATVVSVDERMAPADWGDAALAPPLPSFQASEAARSN